MIKNIPNDLKEIIKESQIAEISIGCSNTNVYKIVKDNKIYFLKIGSKEILSKEYYSLIWLQGKLPVAECVYFISDKDKSYLLTTAIKGEMSCDINNLESSRDTVKLLAKAIKMIQSVDISNCPFRQDLDYKLGVAKYNVDNNLLEDLTLNYFGKNFSNLRELYSYLDENKFEEELCFSHGDTSLPNIFISDNNISGFIDIGECGVGDKWFDIAICYKSIRRNFPGREDLLSLFLTELGVEYSDKIDYYLALMELYL